VIKLNILPLTVKAVVLESVYLFCAGRAFVMQKICCRDFQGGVYFDWLIE